MCLATHDLGLYRWTGAVDRRICQTLAASPAEPGELLFWFSATEGLYEFIDLRQVPGILRGVPGRVVQILHQTGELCEEAVCFLLFGEWVVSLNKPAHQCKSLFLAIQGHRDIDLVVGVLSRNSDF